MSAGQRQNATDEITLARAAELLPRRHDGRKVHVRTVQRWMERGCRGVFLAGQKSGNIWYTSVAAIDQFRSQSTARAIKIGHQINVPTTGQLKRQTKATRARLRAKGFKINDGHSKPTQVQAMPQTP